MATNRANALQSIQDVGGVREVHETMNYPGTAPDKCVTCKGALKVVDLRCEVWQKEKEKVERRSRK
jgi:hypothetical protein